MNKFPEDYYKNNYEGLRTKDNILVDLNKINSFKFTEMFNKISPMTIKSVRNNVSFGCFIYYNDSEGEEKRLDFTEHINSIQVKSNYEKDILSYFVMYASLDKKNFKIFKDLLVSMKFYFKIEYFYINADNKNEPILNETYSDINSFGYKPFADVKLIPVDLNFKNMTTTSLINEKNEEPIPFTFFLFPELSETVFKKIFNIVDSTKTLKTILTKLIKELKGDRTDVHEYLQDPDNIHINENLLLNETSSNNIKNLERNLGIYLFKNLILCRW